nr:MAG TPA: hypothetical protein [Caudoviricetes sp.]DAU61987.1 MAG TPA: hypothetical protein [Caudoviricetes sp.]
MPNASFPSNVLALFIVVFKLPFKKKYRTNIRT